MSGDKRPIEPANETSKLKLKIKAQDGSIVSYEVKPTTVMKTIFEAYSERKQMINYKNFCFFYNGKRIRPEKTVNEVGLKDGDKIDVMLYQNGGGPTH